jgi:hypothetical protein
MIRNQRPPALQIRKAGSLFFLSFPGRAPNQRKSVGDESPNGVARDSFIYLLMTEVTRMRRIFLQNVALPGQKCLNGAFGIALIP